LETAKKNKWTEFTQKHPEFYKFVKFTLVGAVGVPIEIGSYYLFAYVIFKSLATTPVTIWVLEYEGIGFMWSFLLSTALGEAVGFVLNRKMTFAADSNPMFSIFLHMLMVIFTIFATTLLGMEILKFTAAKGGDIARLGEGLAKPIVTILATAWIYPLNRFVIHRKKKIKKEISGQNSLG